MTTTKVTLPLTSDLVRTETIDPARGLDGLTDEDFLVLRARAMEAVDWPEDDLPAATYHWNPDNDSITISLQGSTNLVGSLRPRC